MRWKLPGRRFVDDPIEGLGRRMTTGPPAAGPVVRILRTIRLKADG